MEYDSFMILDPSMITNLSRLEYLNTTACDIHCTLAELLQLPKLKELRLFNCKIGRSTRYPSMSGVEILEVSQLCSPAVLDLDGESLEDIVRKRPKLCSLLVRGDHVDGWITDRSLDLYRDLVRSPGKLGCQGMY